MHAVNLMLWLLYAAIVVAVIATGMHPQLLSFSGSWGAVKGAFLVLWLVFLAYSLRCSMKENLFKTIGIMQKLWWGRQIGWDLYIGLAIFLLVVGAHEGIMAVALWLIPTVIFANLITLVYVLVHFEGLVSLLGG